MGSRSTYGKLAVDIAADSVIGDFDANSVQFEYVSEAVRMSQSHGGGQGIRGTRSRNKERTRILSEAISGPISLEPTPTELSTWLHLGMGGTPSGTSYTLAEALPEFGLLIDRVVRRFVYQNCQVNRLTIVGQQSQPIVVNVDIEGESEIATATVFPVTVPAIDAGQPFIMPDLTFALAADASAFECRAFQIIIDNVIDADRYMNSLTRQDLDATDRIITLSMSIPYDANSLDLHDQAVAGAGGSLTLTNGGDSTVFTFENLKSPSNTPVTSRRGDEIMLDLTMLAYCDSANDELVVTHTVT